MMTEHEIRLFVGAAITITGGMAGPGLERVVEKITAQWLKDRESAAEEARGAIYDDQRDGWNGDI